MPCAGPFPRLRLLRSCGAHRAMLESAQDAHCVDIQLCDVDALVRFSVENKVELVVIGPEAPLVLGLSDRLPGKRHPCLWA